MSKIVQLLAAEIGAKDAQIQAAISLLDEGSTVPFIARYRKEATGGLDDGQLRTLNQRLTYLRELDDRREVIRASIKEQGKLTDSLNNALNSADNKTALEDIYLPFKPKRRTKAQIAIEAGIDVLTDKLTQKDKLQITTANALQMAADYCKPELGFETADQVLEGAKHIVIEQLGDNAQLLNQLRSHISKQGYLTSRKARAKAGISEKEAKANADKYKDYLKHDEKLANVPSHRALAMFRGRNEGVLSLKLTSGSEEQTLSQQAEQIIRRFLNLGINHIDPNHWLTDVVIEAWKKKLYGQLETEQLGLLKDKAETDAIEVFANNLKDVLMSAPAGAKTTMGLDPGLRTGVKIAIVDSTGKYCANATIFPHAPQNHWDKALRTLSNLCRQHKVELIAIGNGTASRETDKLAAEVIKENPDLKIAKVMVSEAGASVYSASELAANEFPDLDVSIRGAISIARRLQDPLAELVKIEAKAIGVGQYQHDVNQNQLTTMLGNVVEDCVNSVGVDLNMASTQLLTRVSGLNKTLAQNIVNYRDEHGAFKNRNTLKKVTRLGPKAFEQCAGFLRITGGENPLDSSGVHPESYPVVEKIIQNLNQPIEQIIGDSTTLSAVNADQYVDDKVGLPTIKDIISELDKPGRDPRPEFKTVTFKEGVNTIADLKPGMILEGVVSNVANFGAFVDIGVHQDGLVHISSLTDKFVSDPREVVKAGDIVKVKVLEADANRKRINLTMRMDEQPGEKNQQNFKGQNKGQNQGKGQHKGQGKGQGKGAANHKGNNKPKAKQPQNAAMGNAFADAFAKLKK